MLRFVALLLLAAPAVAQTDPRVRATLGGTLQLDSRLFPEGPAGDTPGFLVRRARAEVTAEIAGRLRAVGEVDVGEGVVELTDGYLDADLGRGLRVRAGRFKTPFGAESLRSSSDLRFAERAFPTALSPRRDVGAMLSGTWERFGVQAGVFNGVPDGASRQTASDAHLDAAARVVAQPLPAVGLGVAASAGTERGAPGRSELADYDSPGDRVLFDYADGTVADGRRVRLGPHATLDAGPLHVLGEWTWAQHRLATPAGRSDVTHQAWQVAASVVLAGEPRGPRRPAPRRDVTAGGIGAIEVSARVHGLRIDPDAPAAPGAAQRATALGVAAQWSPVSEVRLGVTAERTVARPFAGGAGLQPETVVIVRVALAL